MLKIGKTNQYYTLWSLSTDTRYNSQGLPYEVSQNRYIQNLSKDLKTAVNKAREMGCKDLQVDEDLRGHTTWSSPGEKWEPEVIAPDCFQFGKYKGKNIKEMIEDDIKKHPHEWSDFQSYLQWYFKELTLEDQNELLKALDEFPVLKRSRDFLSFIDFVKIERKGYEPYYAETSRKVYIELMDKINDGKMDVYTLSNFSPNDLCQALGSDYWSIRIQPHGASDEENEAFLKYHSFGKKIVIHCRNTEMNRRYYNGFHYWVPAGLRSFKKSIMRVKLNDDDYGTYRVPHVVTPHLKNTTL